MDQEILDLLARLADEAQRDSLTDDEIADLAARLATMFDETRAQPASPERNALLAQIADAYDATTAETTRRDEERTRLEDEANQLAQRVLGSTEGDGGDGGEGDGQGDGAGDGDQGGEGDGDGDQTTQPDQTGDAPDQTTTDDGSGDVAGDREPALVAGAATRSASRPAPVGAVAQQQRQSGQRQTPAPVHLSRQLPRITLDSGREAETLSDVSEAMYRRLRSFGRVQAGYSERVGVASIHFEYPEDRVLGDSVSTNQRRIEAVVGEDAMVAAGGLCAPFTPMYDLLRISNSDRPVRAAIPSFQATRGGITFRAPFSLGDMANAVDQWTMADDEEAATTTGTPPSKPCLRVNCLDTDDAEIYAVTRCLEFGNVQARTDPESVDNATLVTVDQWAREAEGLLLDALKASTVTTAVTVSAVLGASRDLLAAIDMAVAAYRSRQRMSDNVRLRAGFPFWTRALMRVDLARQMAGDSTLAVTDEQIEQWFTVRGISPWFYVDTPSTGTSQIFGTQGAGALLTFPGDVQWVLYPEGNFVFLDGGELDLGVVRDADLVSTNDFQTFYESFEGLAAVGGFQAYWVTSTLDPNGGASGTVDPATV